MPQQAYTASAPSHTKGNRVDLMVSPEFLVPADKVLIIDDFLARGKTIDALVNLAQQAGSEIKGIGVVIEKSFEGGRQELAYLDVPIHSLVVIASMDNNQITFA
jgi:xanthine phosphoribosyltransferase